MIKNLFFLLFIVQFSAQQNGLGKKIKKGEEFFFKSDMVYSLSEKDSLNEPKITNHIYSIFTNKIVDVQDSVLTLECKYFFLKTEHFFENQDFIFSSSLSKKDYISFGYSKIIGKPFYINIDQNGRITNVNGYKNIQKTFDEAIPDKVKDTVFALTRNFFDEKNLRNAFHFFVFTPKEKDYVLTKNENPDLKSSLPIHHRENYIYTVNNVDKDIIEVGINGKVFADENENLEFEGKKIKPNALGKIEGKIYLDNKKSLLQYGTYTKIFSTEPDEFGDRNTVRISVKFSNSKVIPNNANQRILRIIDIPQRLNTNGALLFR